MSTGPCRALDSPRPPCCGERGPRGPGSHLWAAGSAKPQAGSEPSLGWQRGRGEEPCAISSPRCSLLRSLLLASFAAPGGFLWLPRRGQLVLGWEELGRAPLGGLGEKREGQPPGTRGQRGGSARSSSPPPLRWRLPLISSGFQAALRGLVSEPPWSPASGLMGASSGEPPGQC